MAAPPVGEERWETRGSSHWFNLPETKFSFTPCLDTLCGYFFLSCPFAGCPFRKPPGDRYFVSILEHVKLVHCFPVDPYFEVIAISQEPSRATNNVIFPLLDGTNLSDRLMATHIRRLRAGFYPSDSIVLLPFLKIVIRPEGRQFYVCPHCNVVLYTETGIRQHVWTHVVAEKR